MKGVSILFVSFLFSTIVSYLVSVEWWNLWMYHGFFSLPECFVLKGNTDGESAYDKMHDAMFVILLGISYGIVFCVFATRKLIMKKKQPYKYKVRTILRTTLKRVLFPHLQKMGFSFWYDSEPLDIHFHRPSKRYSGGFDVLTISFMRGQRAYFRVAINSIEGKICHTLLGDETPEMATAYSRAKQFFFVRPPHGFMSFLLFKIIPWLSRGFIVKKSRSIEKMISDSEKICDEVKTYLVQAEEFWATGKLGKNIEMIHPGYKYPPPDPL
jgi:hypothetical protein